MHKRVRVDEYTTDSRVLRITGRSGYETSTDLWVERTLGLKFGSDRDELYERGWHTEGVVNHYSLDWGYTQPNLHGVMEIDGSRWGGLNDSMENLQFKPVGCTNHYDCYPKTQRKILPYLIPVDRTNNVEFMTEYAKTITMGVENMVGSMPDSYRWDPTHNGNFVTTFVENADGRRMEVTDPQTGLTQVVDNPFTIRNHGFCPINYIQFGRLYDDQDATSFYPYDAFPTLLPVYYDTDDDELHWNTNHNLCIRVDPEVFGFAYAGNAPHYFFIDRANPLSESYDHDSWSAKFDMDGIAGRNAPTGLEWLEEPADPGPNATNAEQQQYAQDEAVYGERVGEFMAAHEADVYGLKNAASENVSYFAHLNGFAEFYPLKLWAPAFTHRHAQALSAIPNTWHGNQIDGTNEFTLWLRIPRFSKGQQLNWSMHPGMARFNQWYQKEVDGDLNADPEVVIGGGSEELIPFKEDPLPTQFHEFAYTPPQDVTDTHVGRWSTQWGGENPVVINGVNHNTSRIPRSFTLSINTFLWNELQNLNATDVTTFKLIGGPQLLKPFPTSQQQQAGVIHPADPVMHRAFFIRFQQRHATFIQQNNENLIIFDWITLSGIDQQGQFPWGEFPLGKPFTCSTSDLFPRFGHTVGWMVEPKTELSLIMHHNQNNWGQLAQFYNGNVTEVPNVWIEGSKPLFVTLANAADQFQQHDKVDPTNSDIFDHTAGDLFIKINDMFTGDIFIELPRFDDYRSVLAGQNKATITLKEPLFSLESGMSTYGVKRIFNNAPWYSLLLQDIDLYFQPTDVRKTIFGQGTTTMEIVDNGYSRDLPGVSMDVVQGAQKTTVTVRTRDGRDQRTKMLLSASNPYPFMRQYKGVTRLGLDAADTPTVTISIYSERGIPDWFFIYAERDFPQDIDYIPLGHPIIAGLNFFARANKNRSLCDYMLSKHELWQTTRRNSHPEADLRSLLTEVGGVLIGKADLGTLELDELGRSDCFDYDIAISLENEVDPSGDIPLRVSYPITVTICAIYENGVVLKGGGTRLSFVEIKETNYVAASPDALNDYMASAPADLQDYMGVDSGGM